MGRRSRESANRCKFFLTFRTTIGGHIFDVTGSYSVAFAAGAAALLVAACFVSFVKPAPVKGV